MSKQKKRQAHPYLKLKKQNWPTQGILLALSGFLVPVLALSGAYLGRYALSTRHTEILNSPPLKFLVSVPEYFSVNDDDEIRVRTENLNSKPIPATLRASITDKLMTFVGQEGSNIFYAGTLQGNEQVSSKLNVFFPYDFVFPNTINPGQAVNVLGQTGKFELQGNVDGQDIQPLEMPVQIAPIPGYKQLFTVIISAFGSLILWFSKEWWDQLKEGRKR